MSTISLRLPESLHERVRELAKRQDVSINQFIATALAAKRFIELTYERFYQRLARSWIL